MSTPVGAPGPCIAMVELASIATGLECVDALIKEAHVELYLATAVSPGKYVVLFAGEVEAVSAAYRRAREVGAESLIDSLFIPNVEPTLLAAVRARGEFVEQLDALGVIETLSVGAVIRAGDLASKTASLSIAGMGLARGLGGKCWVAFSGTLSDVEAGVDAGAADAERVGLLVRRLVIPRPHPGMAAVLAGELA